MFKATDPDFQNDAETLFNLPKKAVIVSVDETGKKLINGNHKDTNSTRPNAFWRNVVRVMIEHG